MTGRARRTRAAIDAAGPLLSRDLALTAAAMGLRRRARVRRVMGASEVLDQLPLVSLSAAVALAGQASGDRSLRGAGLRMLVGMGLASALKGVGKGLVARTRPTEIGERGEHRFDAPGEDDGGMQAFPSGHTAGAVATVLPLARAVPAAGPPLALAAGALVALKVVRGDHYPSDLLAGALIGLACAAAARRVVPAAERALR